MKGGLKVACSWSGGKDSCYAMIQSERHGAATKIIATMMNENGRISRSHGLPLSILRQQATAMQLPIIATPTTWIDYERNFLSTLKTIRSRYSVEGMVFGDIDVQRNRDWEEMICTKAAIRAIMPIWKQSRKELLLKMLYTYPSG